jgi:hypothetical protein
MNAATQALIEHIAKRPAPPQATALKATFVKAAAKYSKWLITLDTLTAAVKAADKHYSQMTREEADAAVKEAEAVLRAEYWADIRGIVADIKSELKERLEAGEGGEPLREWLIEYTDSTVDGHHNVIYTYAAQKVVLFSDNAGAYVENYGDEGLADGGDINWSRLAWAAMREDVIEQLEAEGIEYNDPDSDATKEALGLAIDEDEDAE